MATMPGERIRHELPFPEYVDLLQPGGLAVTVTRPAGMMWLVISCNSGSCYMTKAGTAAPPAATVVDGTGMAMIKATDPPLVLNMRNVDSFSIIDGGGGDISLWWYRDNNYSV